MKSIFADPEIPLSGIAQARQQREEFKEDCRRHRVMIADPNRKRAPAWKRRDEKKPITPEWEFERDKAGKITLAKQTRPHPDSMDLDPRFLNRRFISVIEFDPCCFGGEHVEHGCKVDSFAEAAFAIHGHRGKIVEEYQA